MTTKKVLIIVGVLFFTLVNAQNRDLPNIVVIYTDDQGYGDVSALNPQCKFSTPNIDKLAKEGIIFTDGHSSSTVCSPSRYGLLTGRYSWRSSLKKGVLQADGDCLIEDDRETLATLCKKAGYNTAMIGKWHLLIQYPGTIGNRDWTKPTTDGPNEKGFDYFFGLAASMNYGMLTYTKNHHVTEVPSKWTKKKHIKEPYTDYRMCPPYDDAPNNKKYVEVAPSFRDDRVLEIFTQKAVAYIDSVAEDSKDGKPFFLYFPLTSPHLPHAVHPDFIGKSDIGKYGDFMIETDYRVGQVLEALQANGLDNNTLIFFSSDNGAEKNYKYYRDEMGHHCNYHFRGGKRDIYEGGHRVPFIVWWPSELKAGISHQIVCQTDLLATLADLFKIELAENAGEDSYSFLPVLMNHRNGTSKRESIINQTARGYLAYREKEWKLFIGYNKKANEPDYELYNLEDDIQEQNNLYGNHPEIEKHLQEMLTKAIIDGRTTPGEKQKNDGGNWWPQLLWMDKRE